MSPVCFIDLVASVGSLSAIVFLCLGRKRALSREVLVLFSLILALTVLHDVSNFLEWGGITTVPDLFVDRMEVFTVVLWGFFFYTYLQLMTEKALRQSEEKYRRLFEVGSDIIIAFELGRNDGPDRLIEVNEVACKRLGYTKEELLKMTFKDLQDPELGWNMDPIMKTLALNKSAVFDWDYVARDGRKIPVEINARLFNLSGKGIIISIARDITKRLESQRILRELQALDEKILDSSPVGYLVGDREGRATRVSRAFRDVVGLEADTVIGKTLEELLPAGPDPAALQERIRRVYQEKVPVGPTVVMVSEMTPRWVRETLLPLLDPDGKVVNVLAVLENITAEVEARQKLLEISELDEKILSASPVAFILHDPERRVIRVSQAFQEVGGFIPDQVLGKKVEEFLPEGPQRDKIVGNLRKVAQTGAQVGPEEIELPIRGKFVRETIIPVFSPKGKIANILSVLEDVTERKREVDERKKSEKKYRLLFENIQDGVLLQSMGEDESPGRFIQANSAFLNMIGYGENELSNLTLMDICDEAKRNDQKEIEASIKAGRTAFFERVVYPKSGGELFCEMRTDLVDIGGEKVFLSICHDVTQRVLAEKRMRASLKEKEVLLREIHHRVKNNLQVISGLLNLQSYFINDEAVRTIYKESQSRIQTMAMIHEELYRREDLSFVNLNHYLGDLAQGLLASYLVEKDQVRLILDLEELDVVLDTAVPCGLIVNELMSNSLKHAFPDGREGEIRVAFKRSGANRFSLSLSDNGVGLPADFDLKSAKSMGIQLVRVLSEQLGGELQHFSQGGASFRVEFFEYREAETLVSSSSRPLN